MIMHDVPSGLVQLQQLWTHERRPLPGKKAKSLGDSLVQRHMDAAARSLDGVSCHCG